MAACCDVTSLWVSCQLRFSWWSCWLCSPPIWTLSFHFIFSEKMETLQGGNSKICFVFIYFTWLGFDGAIRRQQKKLHINSACWVNTEFNLRYSSCLISFMFLHKKSQSSSLRSTNSDLFQAPSVSEPNVFMFLIEVFRLLVDFKYVTAEWLMVKLKARWDQNQNPDI